MTEPTPAEIQAERDGDPEYVNALNELRGILIAISKIDPSNTGTSVGDERERYAVRNTLIVDAMAAAMRAGLRCGVQATGAATEHEGWPILFIELPDGFGLGDADRQLSWHLPPYMGRYDGHTTAEKYNRIRTFSMAFISRAQGVTDAD